MILCFTKVADKRRIFLRVQIMKSFFFSEALKRRALFLSFLTLSFSLKNACEKRKKSPFLVTHIALMHMKTLNAPVLNLIKRELVILMRLIIFGGFKVVINLLLLARSSYHQLWWEREISKAEKLVEAVVGSPTFSPLLLVCSGTHTHSAGSSNDDLPNDGERECVWKRRKSGSSGGLAALSKGKIRLTSRSYVPVWTE